MTGSLILALDEGSTSARAVLVDLEGRIVAESRNPVVPNFPHPRWVELDPVALWEAQRASMQSVIAKAGVTTDDIVAAGITTHRETAMVWDRKTGQPVHPAIMWMSKQTDEIVQRWSDVGLDERIRSVTGLNNDSYFSAAKIAWIMENVPGARVRAERGELAAGTVDTWLLWNMTGGHSHLTDHSEASRTALFSLGKLDWDEGLAKDCGIPLSLLPESLPSGADFGEMQPGQVCLPGSRPVPIMAIMADQQAGMYGQACFESGSLKNTFGTAGVITANTGGSPKLIDGLTASVGWTVAGSTIFEAEGVVFHSGQTLQWLRERMGALGPTEDIEEVAGRVPDSGGVYLVPAFAGMCAPHWERDARAGIVGLTLATGREHIVRAGVEAMAYQTRDNVDALIAAGVRVPFLKVDGGASRSALLCQFQADILGIPVVRPLELEATALGVAQVAGLTSGLWSPDDIAGHWKADRTFEPTMEAARREELYAGWQEALDTILDH